MNEIMVSICCITYNHEKYIRDCIEGFVMQKTNFPIEIIIYDDASKDCTQDIIKEYASKYSNIITFLQKENQWSKGKYGLLDWLFPAARGKYIALCEGDDYWTDPYKLQKQVDFLESHPDYGLVHTDCMLEYIKKSMVIRVERRNKNIKIPESNYYYEELLIHNIIATATVCVRKHLLKKVLVELVPHIYHWLQSDIAFWIEISKNSKIGYLDEITATHRILEESAQFSKKPIRKYNFINSSYSIRLYFVEKYGCKYDTYLAVVKNYNILLLNYAVLSGNRNVTIYYCKRLFQFDKGRIFEYKLLYLFSANSFSFYFLKITKKIIMYLKSICR